MADGAEQVNNVVHSMRLQPSQFDKKVSRFARRPGLEVVLESSLWRSTPSRSQS